MLENSDYLRDSSNMSVDPLSDLLKLTDAQSVLSGGFTAGGSWALNFPPPDKMKFFALLTGTCQLRVDGSDDVTTVATRDVIFLAANRPFVLASDLSATALDAKQVFSGPNRRFARIGKGDDCVQIGGHVRLDSRSGALLADALPPLMHVRASAPEAAALQAILTQLADEQAAERPGSQLAIALLAQLMFVHALRVHLATAASLPPGRLRAATDPAIAPALRLMHGDPSRHWQLEELAEAAGMSRTTFAVRFKAAAGVAPLAYLTAWRMHLAERAFRDENAPVAELAERLGYTSESAFSNAFKRVTGSAPRSFRRAGTTQRADSAETLA
jgi:AraC-like DNA-binding protein